MSAANTTQIRQLRGVNFTQASNEGCWSERLLKDAVNAQGEYFALAYGPSGVAPDDVNARAAYFEMLERGGFDSGLKYPDLLVVAGNDRARALELEAAMGGAGALATVAMDDERMQELLGMTLMAVECETSKWVGEMMKDFGSELRKQPRLGGKPGLPMSAQVPTLMCKVADAEALKNWEEATGVPVHIWHHFRDRQWGIALSRISELVEEGLVQAETQQYNSGSWDDTKSMYKVYYHYAYELGVTSEVHQITSQEMTATNGKVTIVHQYTGGKVALATAARDVLRDLDVTRSLCFEAWT